MFQQMGIPFVQGGASSTAQSSKPVAGWEHSLNPGEEFIIVSDANAVGVEQQVINAGIGLDPLNEFEKTGVQRRLAAGELQDFNSTFAIHDALNAPLQIL